MTIRSLRAGKTVSTVSAAVAVAVGILTTPAAADATDAAGTTSPGRETDLVAALTNEVITGRLVITGGVARLVDLTVVTQVVDELGRAVGPRYRARLADGGDNSGTAALGEYACVHSGRTNRDFTAFKPTEIFRADDKGKVQALFHPYRQEKARRVGSYSKSVQFEVCGVGGGDLDGDHRLRQMGLGITYPDTATTYKIGQAWQSGETPAGYQVGMGFKLAPEKTPIEISGSISQAPTNKLMGSISTPMPAMVDTFARNAVNAWWQDSCVGSWHGCRWFHGSKDFHGSVAQGLWEFTPAQARHRTEFMVSTFRNAS